MKLLDFLFGRKTSAASKSPTTQKAAHTAAFTPNPAPRQEPEDLVKRQSSERKNIPHKVTFLRNENGPLPGSKYEIYKSPDADSAKAFLKTKKVDSNYHYVLVETPEGNWGIDIKGLYLERLLPFQTDLHLATHEGTFAAIPDTFGLSMAARGTNDNFIADIKCGNCDNRWTDGVRYNNLTIVKCPICKTYNKVDSGNFTVHFI